MFVSVRFLNPKRKKASEKYLFFMDNELYYRFVSDKKEYKDEYNVVYNIINDNGYNYRNSQVIIEPDFQEKPNLTSIINITPVVVNEKDIVLIKFEDKEKEKYEYYNSSCKEVLNNFMGSFNDATISLNNTFNSTMCSTEGNLSGISYNGCNYVNVPSLNFSGCNTYSTIIESPSYSEKENKLKKNNSKENSMFSKMFGGVRFGKVTEGVKISMYGPSFETLDKRYLAYDSTKEEYIDVTEMVLSDKESFCYMMPVNEKNIERGDWILHMNRWVRVVNPKKGGYLVQDPYNKELITILPTKNIFGFNYFTKLYSFMPNLCNTADTDNPFGNMLPFLFMSENKGNNRDMMLMMMAMNGKMEFSNPMMMMLMMEDKHNDMLPFMMMVQENSKKNTTEKLEE